MMRLNKQKKWVNGMVEAPEEFLKRKKVCVIWGYEHFEDDNGNVFEMENSLIGFDNALEAIEIAKKQLRQHLAQENAKYYVPKIQEAEARGYEKGIKEMQEKHWSLDSLFLAEHEEKVKQEAYEKGYKTGYEEQSFSSCKIEKEAYEKGKKETAKTHIAEIEEKYLSRWNEKGGIEIPLSKWEEIKKRWCKK